MKAPPFKYHAPSTLADALSLLSAMPNARVLAGGQSLMPMLNLRVAGPEHLIDLNQIAELRQLKRDGDHIITGAMCTQRSVERSDLVAQLCPLLHQAVLHIGHQQTRNRGTIGGSLAHLDPGAELPVIAAALNAEIEIANQSGTRKVAFSDFAQGYLTNCLEADEIVTAIRWSIAPPSSGAAFHEFNRRPADFAIVSAAVEIVLNAKGAISSAKIALGGIQGAPLVLSDATLIGQTQIDPETAQTLLRGVDCDGDDLYPPDFRHEIAGVFLQRALNEAFQHARSAAHV